MMLKRLALFALVLGLALIVLAPDSATAARPGGGSKTPATLVVTPDPAPANDYFHAAGCGFAVGKVVNIMLDDGSSSAFFAVGTDADGCIAFTYMTGSAGSYKLDAYQNLKGKQQTLVASTTFAVQ